MTQNLKNYQLKQNNEYLKFYTSSKGSKQWQKLTRSAPRKMEEPSWRAGQTVRAADSPYWGPCAGSAFLLVTVVENAPQPDLVHPKTSREN